VLFKESQEETTMLRQMSFTTRALAMAATLALPTITLAQADNRPVVVVFRFANNSIGKDAADFAGTEGGMQDLLITSLAANPKVRIVDRTHLNEILTEQKMSKDGQIDPATAVRVGKILGAQYAITGMFMSDGKGKVRLTGRTIDIETTQIINPQTLDGKADDVLAALTSLGDKVSSTMNLAPKPGAGRRVGDAGDAAKSAAPAQSGSPAATKAAAPATSTTELYAKPTTKPEGMKVKLDAPRLKLYSKALDEMDKGNKAEAIKLLKQVENEIPGFEPVQRNLKKLGAA
jgi:TolB-like protein